MGTVFAFSLVTVFLLWLSTYANCAQSSASQCKSSCGMAGMPGQAGSNGIPGIPGTPGCPGSDGPKGEKGAMGEKGDSQIDTMQRANWKQCAWRTATDTDNGLVNKCSFNKLHDRTALKVSYQGNIRMHSHSSCNRWFFKFNGSECSGPLPIDLVLYSHWPSGRVSNVHHPSFMEGYCENLPRGAVRVEVWVGKCPSFNQGDAYTGWNSVSRIIIEEVPPSQ